MKIQKYVGLDVHKDKTTVAMAEGDRTGEVRAYGEISSDLVTTEKALRKIKGEHGVLHVRGVLPWLLTHARELVRVGCERLQRMRAAVVRRSGMRR